MLRSALLAFLLFASAFVAPVAHAGDPGPRGAVLATGSAGLPGLVGFRGDRVTGKHVVYGGGAYMFLFAPTLELHVGYALDLLPRSQALSLYVMPTAGVDLLLFFLPSPAVRLNLEPVLWTSSGDFGLTGRVTVGALYGGGTSVSPLVELGAGLAF
jgi:hypothetical protein